MTKFSLPMHGGCLCGRHRYAITARPLTLYACHCTDCQSQSGAAFGLSMPVPRNAVTCDLAALGTWTRPAASGQTVTAYFCPHCATRLFHAPSRNPDVINLKPGTLDDTAWLAPVAHLWLDSAQPWIRPPDDALTFPGQPDRFAAIFARFTERFPDEPRP